MSNVSIEVVFQNDNGDEVVVDLPGKYEVCSDCDGHGTVLNESMRFHAYTEEEFSDFSDDDREQYFKRGGIYDVVCPTCKGKRVEGVVDEDAKFTPEQTEALKAMREREADRREYESLCRMERMMGA